MHHLEFLSLKMLTGSKAALVSSTRVLFTSHIRKHDLAATELAPMFFSSDSQYDSSHSSTFEDQSDLDSDESDEMDGFAEHIFEVLFIADNDIKQVGIA